MRTKKKSELTDKLLGVIKRGTKLITFISLPFLIGMFFYFLFYRDYMMALTCVAGIYVFYNLNLNL